MDDNKPTPDPTILSTQALEREVSRMKELVDAQIDGLREVVAIQFKLIEERRVEQKDDTKAGLEAALAAAKEAVNKAEVSTAERLKELKATFDTAISGVTSTVSDLGRRMERAETQRQSAGENKTGLYAALAAGVAIMTAVSIIANMLTN